MVDPQGQAIKWIKNMEKHRVCCVCEFMGKLPAGVLMLPLCPSHPLRTWRSLIYSSLTSCAHLRILCSSVVQCCFRMYRKSWIPPLPPSSTSPSSNKVEMSKNPISFIPSSDTTPIVTCNMNHHAFFALFILASNDSCGRGLGMWDSNEGVHLQDLVSPTLKC